MTRRIGVFGGTFDPVHNAHVALANAALGDLQLDQVRWIPSGHSWQKEHRITAAEHRAAMVQLAIADEPRFVLDSIEISRPGSSFTLDTLLALDAAMPATDWVLILGQDQYSALHTWHDWQRLLALVTVAVANRPGLTRPADAAVQAFAHRAVPLPMLNISSTDIRNLAALGKDIAHLVPPQVARYIDLHGLYREPNRS